jgi:P27 family predicted phage terminase small subunit
MVKGRIPKPSKLRLIEGNRGHRPINQREAQPAVAPAVPDPPAFLSDPVARAEWVRVASALHPVGLLSEADTAVLGAYCHSYARWRQAEDALRKMGATDSLTGALMIKTSKGTPIQNPLVGTANKAMQAMVRYAAEFGMTPAARSRIEAGPLPNSDMMTRLFG